MDYEKAKAIVYAMCDFIYEEICKYPGIIDDFAKIDKSIKDDINNEALFSNVEQTAAHMSKALTEYMDEFESRLEPIEEE